MLANPILVTRDLELQKKKDALTSFATLSKNAVEKKKKKDNYKAFCARRKCYDLAVSELELTGDVIQIQLRGEPIDFFIQKQLIKF